MGCPLVLSCLVNNFLAENRSDHYKETELGFQLQDLFQKVPRGKTV